MTILLMFLTFLISILMVIVGFFTIRYGKTLPTWKEDTDRIDSRLYDFLYPPGKKRADALIGGILLMSFGVATFVYVVVRALLY
ncbi:MAG: hypothetical protein K1X52_02990 [Pyrinomonadaceae bacterium]|nr:hypothetical protein [Pyrinomonadaceae bacterium]